MDYPTTKIVVSINENGLLKTWGKISNNHLDMNNVILKFLMDSAMDNEVARFIRCYNPQIYSYAVTIIDLEIQEMVTIIYSHFKLSRLSLKKFK